MSASSQWVLQTENRELLPSKAKGAQKIFFYKKLIINFL